jgi:hypothetical protein
MAERGIDDADLSQKVRALLDDLARIASDDTEPSNLRALARMGIEFLTDMEAAVRSGNHDLAHELFYGPQRESKSSRPGGILQKLPLWARGTETLVAAAQFIEVDEAGDPPSVIVHWDQVPSDLRREVASLASELVDRHRPRPKGGRGNRKEIPPKPGDPVLLV